MTEVVRVICFSILFGFARETAMCVFGPTHRTQHKLHMCQGPQIQHLKAFFEGIGCSV